MKDAYITAIFQSYGSDIKHKTLEDILSEFNIREEKETLEYFAYKFHEFVKSM
jgi:ribosomal protein L12E/L44/L45/RPP1/RPP2